MLEEVRIQGLGVIDDAVLELHPGLTVVTGETGAGKTMVVTGLGLLFGGRADAGRVRPGARRTAVEGTVTIDPESPAAVRASDAGGEIEDGTLIVTRTVSSEGRSRAYVGGRAAPVGLLAELADDLIAVHGQADQQRLLRPARQRSSLDRFAGPALAHALPRYEHGYARHREVDRKLGELTTASRERAREVDLLRLGLAEIEQADPSPREDDELDAEAERLRHADVLRTAATTAHEALLGDPTGGGGADAVGLVGTAREAVESVQSHDPELAGLANRLAEAGYLLSDIAGDLASYMENIDVDPARLAAVEERRAVLGGLTRKYGDDVSTVLAWAREAVERLAELEGDDERLDALRLERDALMAELRELADELAAVRRKTAVSFAEEVTAELADLAMPHARVDVEVRSRDELGPHGADEVEIRLASHPDAPFLPLHRGASGGELSRVMLAVEVVFAGADPVPTFVFDEVDAGVGGKAAVEVGRRLARLARTAQVIVVTHLPQVAAFADRHLVVEKTDDGRVTRSGVRALGDPERTRELSRMLAGLEDSDLGQAHAEELLAVAERTKSDTL